MELPLRESLSVSKLNQLRIAFILLFPFALHPPFRERAQYTLRGSSSMAMPPSPPSPSQTAFSIPHIVANIARFSDQVSLAALCRVNALTSISQPRHCIESLSSIHSPGTGTGQASDPRIRSSAYLYSGTNKPTGACRPWPHSGMDSVRKFASSTFV